MHDAARRIIELYDRHAEAWDKARRAGPLIEKAWLERFMALLPPKAAVLDLGCGTGEPIGRHLCDAGHDVTGVDSSANLIALCQARTPQITSVQADMRQLSLGTRFHGVIAWHSFFHLTADDQRAMFEVFSAHALPGAALMFTSGSEHGVAMGTFEGEPLYHASLDTSEYRDRLEESGFNVVSHVEGDETCGGATVWLARKRR